MRPMQTLIDHGGIYTSIDWQCDVLVACNTAKIILIFDADFGEDDEKEDQIELKSFYLRGIIDTKVNLSSHLMLTHINIDLIHPKNFGQFIYRVSTFTDNGYIMCWNLTEDKNVLKFCKKIHDGPIEAMDFKQF